MSNHTTNQHAVIFDWKQTLYQPDTTELYDGAPLILQALSAKHIPLHLIGKGYSDMLAETQRLGVAHFFTSIIFKPADKDIADFAAIIDEQHPEHTFVVGDRVRSELTIGNQLGATTIQVCQGTFAHELPQNKLQIPRYTVSNLQQAHEIIESLI